MGATSGGEGSCLFPDMKSCVLCLLHSTACPLRASTNLFSQHKEMVVRYGRVFFVLITCSSHI